MKSLDINNPDNSLRCFVVNIEDNFVMPKWITDWKNELASGKFKMRSRHEEALARLIPLLLCGEQSAIHVFGNEVERLRGVTWTDSIELLKEIESDEYVHEHALQTLSSLLAEPEGLNQIKRKSRHFYLKFGRAIGVAEHFDRVAHLDACVCIIMNAITKCDLGKGHIITQLFDRIKKDEARHVYVSNKHSKRLGCDQTLQPENKSIVSSELVSLLRTEADSFESLGIDSDKLFHKLENVRQR
jgi:hypothetical protein